MELKTRSSLFDSHSVSGSALLCSLLIACLAIVCHAGETNSRDLDLQLDEQPNRQYFKLHLVPGVKATKMLLPKSKFARQADQRAATTTAGADGDEPIKLAANKGQKQEKQSPASRQKAAATISNATLKKLLNQTLLKSASNNSTEPPSKPGQKASKNFKFVFIQRATAAPHLDKTSSPPSAQASSAAGPPTTSPKEQSSPAIQEVAKASSSLAASVSKQLATSLLHSAAGLVANLSSSASLSSLASQIVVAASNSISESPASTRRTNSTLSSSQLSAAESSETSDRRDQQQQVGANSSNETGSSSPAAANKASGSRVTKKGTKSKQAKIYNLPVKFVANGQPNHVAVFSTLKEHFATIKRLQALSGSANGGGAKTIASAGSRLNKKRKQQQQQQQQQRQRHKLKGTNSRLIYLPLRYLSNAKANKIMITSAKAAHKLADNS